MNEPIYRTRLSVEIDPVIKSQLDNLIRWGQLRHVVEAMLLDLVELIRELDPADRELVLAGIIGKKFRPRDFLKTLGG